MGAVFGDFMQKLVFARQIKFQKGRIDLANQRVVISPIEPMYAITEVLLENKKMIPTMYEKIRNSFSKGFTENISKMYKVEGLNLTKWLVDVSNMGGWGKTTLVKFDNKAHTGILKVEDSPFVQKFKNKTDIPVDHIWRSITAAGATRIFGEDIDFIETKCAATGKNKVCEFLYKPRKDLTATEKKQYGWQLPVK
jgi:predicted hydrocarbon binding protein